MLEAGNARNFSFCFSKFIFGMFLKSQLSPEGGLLPGRPELSQVAVSPAVAAGGSSPGEEMFTG